MNGQERTTQQSKDCVVVGGGIHGTVIARALLDSGIEPDSLALVDPHDELLASFRKKARACGMAALRSSFVQHLGSEPFSLENFATTNGRENELVMTVDYPARPSLSLFLDHAESIIDSREIDSLHSQATVEAIEREGGKYCVETNRGSIRTKNVVLAIGRGGRYQYPEWADVRGVTHVWDGFDPAVSGETIVVGGGITAVTLACALADNGSVTLLTRHALEWAVAEAGPPWINWSHIEANLQAEQAECLGVGRKSSISVMTRRFASRTT